MLLVEQHFELAMELAQQVIVLQRGEIAVHGSPEHLRRDANLLAYLASTSATG